MDMFTAGFFAAKWVGAHFTWRQRPRLFLNIAGTSRSLGVNFLQIAMACSVTYCRELRFYGSYLWNFMLLMDTAVAGERGYLKHKANMQCHKMSLKMRVRHFRARTNFSVILRGVSHKEDRNLKIFLTFDF